MPSEFSWPAAVPSELRARAPVNSGARTHMKALRILGIWTLLVLEGCASAPREFEQLENASGRVIFELDKGIQVKDGNDAIYLAQGGYRIVKSGRQGSMYVGPDYGVIRRSARGYLGYPGGVWIPADRDSKVQVFVFVGLGERLYTNLSAALTLPSEAERKMEEQALLAGIDDSKFGRQSCAKDPLPPPGGVIGPASVAILCAIFEYQRGKPDVIGELPRMRFENLVGPSAPARVRP